jgi:predicted dehydrogenase
MDMPGSMGLEVVGASGSLLLTDPWHGRDARIELRRADGSVEDADVEQANPYAMELRDLAGAAAGLHPPLLGREDAVGQARAIAALYASAASHEAVAP